MRASFLIGAASLAWPAMAHAHPFDVRAFVEEPTPPADDAAPEATSSKAPESGDAMPEPSEPVTATEPEPEAVAAEPAAEGEPEETTLDAERSKARSRAFNKHGIGVRGGVT